MSSLRSTRVYERHQDPMGGTFTPQSDTAVPNDPRLERCSVVPRRNVPAHVVILPGHGRC